MKLRLHDLAVSLPLVLLGCATGPKPEWVTAPGVDLAAYASFGLEAPVESSSGADRPQSILDATLRDAIRAQLAEKGYREAEPRPELRIRWETAAYVEEKSSNPVRIGVGVGSWGGNVGGSVDASVPVGREGVVSTTKSRLTIRAIDPASNREVWVGSTAGDFGEAFDARVVESAVASVLEGFPARRR